MLNLKVRFNKNNMTFIIRFLGALVVPVLAYMGVKFEEINSWVGLFNVLKDFVSNPYLVVLTLVNAINLLPDPTTPGVKDSDKALQYIKPGVKNNG